MQRYFAKDKIDNTLILHDGDYYHITKVMRNSIGDEVEIIYANEVHLCEITSLNPVSLKIKEVYSENRNLPVELTVAISLVTEQKMDLILQKLTELGVTRIIPLKTERSIIKLDENKITKKLSRWQSICKEASEQSKRTDIPIITNIMTLKELINMDAEIKLLCSLQDNTLPINEYLKDNLKSILFTIGPEGGFSEQEETYLLENHFMPTSLGKRVLRVETAAIYVASIINYVYRG